MSLSLEGKIGWFACLSRILVILLQVLFNHLIQDHNALVFNPPIDPTRHVVADKLVVKIFGGFRRWDSLYFLHVAEYGYAYDNSLAFFPLFPLIVRLVASTLFYPLHFIMSTSCVYLLAGVLVNFIVFIYAAKTLYFLSLKVLKDQTLAYKSALLFCINPASIFMSAAYSETLFAFLGFCAMLKYQTSSNCQSAIYVAMAGLTRSNGVVYAAFILYGKIRDLILQLLTVRSVKMDNWTMTLSASAAVCWIILCPTIVYTMICVTPFILYQIYAYFIFCNKAYAPDIPMNVEWYGQEMEYNMVGLQKPAWCNHHLPFSYSYIQSHHWGLGFMHYFQVKQIPNFLLAVPIILLTMAAARYYYNKNRAYCLSLGLADMDYAQKKKDQKPKIGFEGAAVFVYVVHAMALLIFGLLFMHVQVVTRLVLSSSPVVYWFVAMMITPEDHVVIETNPWNITKNLHKQLSVESEVNSNSRVRNLLLNQIVGGVKNNWKSNVILAYFLLYFFVGIVMHVNFFPWT